MPTHNIIIRSIPHTVILLSEKIFSIPDGYVAYIQAQKMLVQLKHAEHKVNIFSINFSGVHQCICAESVMKVIPSWHSWKKKFLSVV